MECRSGFREVFTSTLDIRYSAVRFSISSQIAEKLHTKGLNQRWDDHFEGQVLDLLGTLAQKNGTIQLKALTHNNNFMATINWLTAPSGPDQNP